MTFLELSIPINKVGELFNQIFTDWFLLFHDFALYQPRTSL